MIIYEVYNVLNFKNYQNGQFSLLYLDAIFFCSKLELPILSKNLDAFY